MTLALSVKAAALEASVSASHLRRTTYAGGCGVSDKSDSGIDDVIAALTSEDEIAHGEAWDDVRKMGLGSCAYCDDEWPCRTQRGIDRLLGVLYKNGLPDTEGKEQS